MPTLEIFGSFRKPSACARTYRLSFSIRTSRGFFTSPWLAFARTVLRAFATAFFTFFAVFAVFAFLAILYLLELCNSADQKSAPAECLFDKILITDTTFRPNA